MFIPNSRIRRVETPDASTPGAVPPVVPPAAPPAAPAAAATPAPAPAGAPKPPSKGLLIGLIAGGAVLLIAAIIAIVVLVLPALFGGSTASSDNRVVDINSEPDTTWKYEWAGDNDEDFLESAPRTVSVGENLALVWPEFDYYAFSGSQGNSAGWYQGYDEQYDDGYDAGLQYAADYDAYWDDYTYTVPYPDSEDYFPEGAYYDYENWLGFQDGFYDAAYDYGEGYSKKEKPVDPDFTPTLTLLNVTNGDEVWTVDLSEVSKDVTYESYYDAYDVADSNAVVVVGSTRDDDEIAYFAATLDKGNGEVISMLEADGPLSVASAGGDVILGVSDEDGDETVIGRYSIGGLDEDPKWEADVDGTPYMLAQNGFLFVYNWDDEEGVVIDVATGEETKWGDDIDSDVYYSFLGTQLLRIEEGKKGYEIEGYNTSGDSVWSDAVDSEMNPFTSNGVLLIAEEDGDGYSELMRINPSNGSEMWGEAYDDEFDYVLGAQGNSILVVSGNKVIVLDAGSGQERFNQKVGDAYTIYLGTNQYYVYAGDELVAYSYNEKGDVWTFDVDDDESIRTLGSHLVLVNDEKGTINGLGSK